MCHTLSSCCCWCCTRSSDLVLPVFFRSTVASPSVRRLGSSSVGFLLARSTGTFFFFFVWFHPASVSPPFSTRSSRVGFLLFCAASPVRQPGPTRCCQTDSLFPDLGGGGGLLLVFFRRKSVESKANHLHQSAGRRAPKLGTQKLGNALLVGAPISNGKRLEAGDGEAIHLSGRH